MRENPIMQFVVLILAVTAGLIVLKMIAASVLPENGAFGALKQLIAGV
jgi:hypothetical protein